MTKRFSGCAALTLALAACLPLAQIRAQSIPELFKRVKDSVVVVKVTQLEVDANTAPAQTLSTGSLGSGVLIDPKGLVLTAAHLVQTADSILVSYSDETVVSAKVVGAAPMADLALLKVDKVPAKISATALGDSDAVEVGDEIFIVGAPLGISYTLTVGHVSGRRDSEDALGGLEKAELLQTDAVINVGNSGGPMFNMQGEVVGIVSHMISRTGSFEGLGFAVASETAKRLLLQRRSPWIGVEGFLLRDDMAAAFNVPQTMGLLVQRVAPNSPAASMGLKGGSLDAVVEGEPMRLGGDIILAYDGLQLSRANLTAIRDRMSALKPGKLATLTVLRGGRTAELNFVLPEGNEY